MNEFPYYLICQKCTNSPTIELKDNENINYLALNAILREMRK